MKTRRRAALLSLLMLPLAANADFAWPPAFYIASYSIWWVVVSGLLIEGVVYYFAWRRGVWATAKLTVGVNAASALAGVIYSLGSFLFMAEPKLAIAFIWASPLLILGLTVLFEYWAGVWLFTLPRTGRTMLVLVAANIPSVGIAIYGTANLVMKALRWHGT
jgi:hypothetical protein